MESYRNKRCRQYGTTAGIRMDLDGWRKARAILPGLALFFVLVSSFRYAHVGSGRGGWFKW
ncbi:MAG TPA: hypothetical protein GX513_11665 [Firmicutes bacterium]|nr:hypothetical protein [Bacillota bacterium]